MSSPVRPARANPLSSTPFPPILGQRAYRDMIRTGTSKASVRAVFTKVPNFPWFEENGVEYDGETVIQRDIFLDGKNVCG